MRARRHIVEDQAKAPPSGAADHSGQGAAVRRRRPFWPRRRRQAPPTILIPNSQVELEPPSLQGYTGSSRTPTRSTPEDLIYMDTFPDLGSLTDQELKELIKELTDEEMEISYRRRILHGKIDILRAELVNRLRKKDETGELVITGADVQQLTDILAGRVPGSESE
jgi:RsiG-like